MHVRQAKGKKHIRYIYRRAMRLWKSAKWQRGLWDECLRTALENHRKRIETELIDNIREQQVEFHCCDRNGWIG